MARNCFLFVILSDICFVGINPLAKCLRCLSNVHSRRTLSAHDSIDYISGCAGICVLDLITHLVRSNNGISRMNMWTKLATGFVAREGTRVGISVVCPVVVGKNHLEVRWLSIGDYGSVSQSLFEYGILFQYRL